MELSSSLLKEFAETTNDSEEVTSRSTAYGTVVTGSDYRTYVQLDGSDQLTAISEGTAVQAGDRVIVTIENHVATVTTNLSVPATGRLTSTMVNEAIVEGYFDVLTAEFATFEYVDTYYISAEEADLKYATIEILASDYITTKDIEATFATIENLNASIANINEAFIGYAQIIDADIQNLYAATANIDDLTATVAKISEAYISYEEVQRLLADYATISRLEAETAEIQTAFIEYAGITTADIEELFADLAVIQETYITQATINELLAGYATISDLQATYANIETLSASVANITNVLAGNVGTGDLQTIYLTSDNAVIDSAVIVDALIGTVLADIIQSNVIYTDQITIMSEDGGIYIVGNQMQFSNGQIQFYDDNGVCRLQIGQDTSGNFTFVLYDETGTGIMIDSEGIHESAVPDGLIVDSMVAEDANIAASKIDMADVISYINDSGDLVLDAYQIYIDGERLDYKLTEITESAVSEVINYYAIGSSPYEPPYEPGEETVYTDAICGIAICGLTYVGTIGWTTRRLYASNDGEYVWFVQKKIYVDGSYSWTEPTCLTDDYVRTKVSTMTTELEVVQGEISAKIWLTDIEDATNVLGDEITTITDQYAELDITINEISAALGELTTSIGPEFEYFYSAIAEITVQIDNISMGVSQNLEYIYGIYDEIEDLESQGIKSRTAYFAISYSPDYYPPYSFSPSVYTAITGLAICGLAVVGNTGYWTTEQPIPEEGQYVWLSYYVEKLDGSTYWETPILLSDEAAREQFTYISSQIAGIQILLDEIDIGIQNVYSYVDDEIEVVNERTAEIVLTLDEIDLGLKSLESVETEHYNYLYDQYTGISMELGSITARVEEVASESGEAVKNRIAYFAVSYSADYYPTLPSLTNGSPDLSVSVYTAIAGLAICGLAIVGNAGYWTKDQPIPEEGQYVWISYLVETINGEVYWETPILLSDEAARKEISYMSERYAEIAVTLDSINLEIYSLYSDYDYTLEQFSDINMTIDSITSTVYQLEVNLNDSVNDFSEKYSQISQDLDSINLYVQDVESTVGGLQSLVSSIDVELGSITTRVESTENGLSSSMKSRKAYYAVSYSPDYYPDKPDIVINMEYDLTTGELIYLGYEVDLTAGYWTTEQPIPEEGQYVWIMYLIETNNGLVYWEDPILLSDDAARKQIAQIQVELDSITMSVYDSGNGMASIQMVVGDEVTSAVEVVTEASKAFENEINNNSSITISAGYVAFISNTLVIESSQISLDLEGNLTINTPQFTLDANGNATFSGIIYAAAGGTIGGFTIGSSSLYNGPSSISDSTSGVCLSTDGIRINASDNSSYIRMYEGGMMRYGSDGSYVSITNNGSVLCDWTNPSSGKFFYDLDVYSGLYGFRYSSSTDNYACFGLYSTTSGGRLDVHNSSGAVSISLVGSSGNINIGTANEVSGRLNITTTNSYGIYYTETASNVAAEIYIYQQWSGRKLSLQIGSGGYNRGLYDNENGHWMYYLNEDNQPRIGNAYHGEAGGTSFRPPMQSDADSDHWASFISTRSNGSMRVYGNWGAYDGVNSSYWSFSGSSSDARLKRNIEDTSVNDALSQILAIRHREFTWIKDNYYVDLGYVAQEMEIINPRMVVPPDSDDEDGDNYYAIDTFYMTSLITKSIQELYEFTMDRDDNLQLQIDDLKAENKALKEELAAIKAA